MKKPLPPVAFVDEPACVGCARCLQVCPTDAIVGADNLMHTVIAPDCTGCERCLPVCPTDCISLQPRLGESASSLELARRWRARYRTRKARLQVQAREVAAARRRVAASLRGPH